MHTLIFFDPGHFHAALTLRKSNPRVADCVHLYAPPGPDRQAFLDLVSSFNSRSDRPTRWEVEIHDRESPSALLADLIAAPPGDAVVLAGKNDRKLATIAALHEAGLHVLADKPWALNAQALPDLARLTAAGPVAMDIMTNRFDVVAALRRAIALEPDLFGGFAHGEEPDVEIGSVHHLVKMVNGAALRRPPWYYDVSVQGDGVVDIQTHMTDQAQWLQEPGEPFEFTADVQDLRAQRWATDVSLELYRQSTGAEAFSAQLAPALDHGVLALACNGQIDYRLRGMTVRQRAEWRGLEPSGGGNLHATVLRGNLAQVVVRQGPETGYRAELHVCPREGGSLESALRDAVRRWQGEYPGLEVAPSALGFEMQLPSALRTGHEAHFAMVLESFLDRLDTGKSSPGLRERIAMRYTLLAHAHETCTDAAPTCGG